mgnify:CR=1 FL=1
MNPLTPACTNHSGAHKIFENNKEEILYYGYLAYDQIMADVELFYEDGADAVEMEMITEKEFEKELETKFMCQSRFAQEIEKLVANNDNGRFINGSNIIIDGGASIKLSTE